MTFRSFASIYETGKEVDWLKVLVNAEVFDQVLEQVLSFYVVCSVKIFLLKLFLHCCALFLLSFRQMVGWYESDEV